MMIFERHANLKYKYGNRHFWAEGYYVSTVGLNTATMQKYIVTAVKKRARMFMNKKISNNAEYVLYVTLPVYHKKTCIFFNCIGYIREQEKEDQIMDKLKTKEYSDPFKGSK